MNKVQVIFKKAIAAINFRKAVAKIQLGIFIFFKFFTENIGVADSAPKSFHKFINENFTATDDLDGEATAQDDQEITFFKVRSDLAAMTDTVTIAQGKLLGDTSALTDSGSYRGQGYCAFDYFESDYVGYSGTF